MEEIKKVETTIEIVEPVVEPGKIIVIEGACDGMGKSTQFELLKGRLTSDGKELVNHHFPSYGTFHGEPVVRYLKGELGDPAHLSPYMINSLYAVDRAIAWNKHLREQWQEGKVILLDRYTTSSLIYQSALITDIEEKKAFIDYVCEFEYEKMGIGKPDDVIFLHAPFDLVTEMRNARKVNDGVANDIHERDLEFMKRVYESAMFVADYLGWSAVRCDKDGKMRSIEEIHEDVYKLAKKNFTQK